MRLRSAFAPDWEDHLVELLTFSELRDGNYGELDICNTAAGRFLEEQPYESKSDHVISTLKISHPPLTEEKCELFRGSLQRLKG